MSEEKCVELAIRRKAPGVADWTVTMRFCGTEYKTCFLWRCGLSVNIEAVKVE
jgi:hypothetical protein